MFKNLLIFSLVCFSFVARAAQTDGVMQPAPGYTTPVGQIRAQDYQNEPTSIHEDRAAALEAYRAANPNRFANVQPIPFGLDVNNPGLNNGFARMHVGGKYNQDRQNPPRQ